MKAQCCGLMPKTSKSVTVVVCRPVAGTAAAAAAAAGGLDRGGCATQLAAYKVPEGVTIVDTLPLNALGKLDRAALAALAAG